MTRQAFAARVGKKYGAEPGSIILILTALSMILPNLFVLCQPTPEPEPEPVEKRIKRACRDHPILARRKIMAEIPRGTRGKRKIAEGIRVEIAATPEKSLKAMLEESDHAK